MRTKRKKSQHWKQVLTEAENLGRPHCPQGGGHVTHGKDLCVVERSLVLQLISEVKSGLQTIPQSASGFTELWAPFCCDMSLMNTNGSIPTVLPNLPWELSEWKDLSSVYLMLIRHHSASTTVSTKYSKFNVLSRFTLSFKFFKVGT